MPFLECPSISYRTMPVGRLVLLWPVQSLPIWLRHLSVWMPIKDFPALDLDGPLHFDGSGSHSPKFVGYSGTRQPRCRTLERLCPQKVHLRSPWKITQISNSLNYKGYRYHSMYMTYICKYLNSVNDRYLCCVRKPLYFAFFQFL